MTYKNILDCRCCGKLGTLETYLDLTEQPLANSYHKDGEKLPTYPLAVKYCTSCSHSQLSIAVDPNEMFKHYLYASGTNPALKTYSDEFAKWITDLYKTKEGYPGHTILDIACNDGTQLDSFKDLGWDTVGIDPAENLVGVAEAKGHEIHCAYWNQRTAWKFPIRSDRRLFDVITAQNVFAHTDNLVEFLEACKVVMREDSLLIIQTSQANQIKNGEFDTIYHEHLSFFNTRSMLAITHRCGLKLERVEKTDIHGTSYVFFISKTGKVLGCDNVEEHLHFEGLDGLYDIETYEEFGKKANSLILALNHILRHYRETGHTLIGYGAAAKGMTVLNFGHIRLDAIIDDSPLKQGLLTPGMNIPIHSREWLKDNWPEKVIFIPLAWNFFDIISERINEMVPDGKKASYIQYFPEIRIK